MAIKKINKHQLGQDIITRIIIFKPKHKDIIILLFHMNKQKPLLDLHRLNSNNNTYKINSCQIHRIVISNFSDPNLLNTACPRMIDSQHKKYLLKMQIN